jgi:AraC-like DNA-binding protein
MGRIALTPDFHDHKAGQAIELHAHEDGQVLVAAEGSMHVWLDDTRLTLAPRAALWVPPGVPHAARSLEDTAFRGVMIDVPRSASLPQRVARFAAAPLFVAATLGLVDARTTERTRASRLLFDELASHLSPQTGPLVPRDPRFAELCARAMEDVADAPSLDEAASQVGMSRRSFTRAFRAATGLAWIAWVREARLAQAAALLAEGARVTDAALTVGYATPSAFSFAFRRGLGKAPVRLRRS